MKWQRNSPPFNLTDGFWVSGGDRLLDQILLTLSESGPAHGHSSVCVAPVPRDTRVKFISVSSSMRDPVSAAAARRRPSVA